MPKSLEIICTIDELRTKIAPWRKDKLSIGLVPTMGALHGGQLSLVARSVADNDRTCVTIFVNPYPLVIAVISSSVNPRFLSFVCAFGF